MSLLANRLVIQNQFLINSVDHVYLLRQRRPEVCDTSDPFLSRPWKVVVRMGMIDCAAERSTTSDLLGDDFRLWYNSLGHKEKQVILLIPRTTRETSGILALLIYMIDCR